MSEPGQLTTEPAQRRQRIRRTADERREDVIAAAIIEFATYGLHGASTEAIAERAGISQPYVLRLFGTKKALFLAAVDRVCAQIIQTWQHGLNVAEAAAGPDEPLTPRDRLGIMGQEYIGLVKSVVELRLVLQAYASAEDEDVRASVHRWLGELFRWVREHTGADAEEVRQFFSIGMMLTVAASIQAADVAPDEAWARAYLMQPIDTPGT